MTDLDTDKFAPYCVATRERPSGVEIFVLPTAFINKLEEALDGNKAVLVATINGRLAPSPDVTQAIRILADALGVAVNELASYMRERKTPGYKSLDRMVDTSHPH